MQALHTCVHSTWVWAQVLKSQSLCPPSSTPRPRLPELPQALGQEERLAPPHCCHQLGPLELTACRPTLSSFCIQSLSSEHRWGAPGQGLPSAMLKPIFRVPCVYLVLSVREHLH